MTLSTDIIICEPVPPNVLFDYALGLLARGVSFEPKWKHVAVGEPYSPGGSYRARHSEYMSVIGQGLSAVVEVVYADDGPLRIWDDETLGDARDDDPDFVPPWFDQHLLRLNFDTGYGYRGPQGGGCSDLHAWLAEQCGAWLAERGVSKVVWQNEFTGEYHTLSEIRGLGDPMIGAL